MTKRKPPGHDFTDRPIEKWNVNHFHAWLIAETKARFGVDYAPFGKGSISQRWATEKGQLKQAQGQYGNTVLRAWIERELDDYRPSAQFPFINFGFMYAYRRDNVARIQSEIARRVAEEKAVARSQSQAGELDDDWI